MKWWRELDKAWARHPPADWLVAAYFKYKPPVDVVHKQDRPKARPITELLQEFGIPLTGGQATIR